MKREETPIKFRTEHNTVTFHLLMKAKQCAVAEEICHLRAPPSFPMHTERSGPHPSEIVGPEKAPFLPYACRGELPLTLPGSAGHMLSWIYFYTDDT